MCEFESRSRHHIYYICPSARNPRIGYWHGTCKFPGSKRLIQNFGASLAHPLKSDNDIMVGTRFSIEVQPKLPGRLSRLQELAEDLLYSWDRQVRGLFFRLDRALWESSGHNPKLFLRRVSQQRLEEAAEDRVFLEDYNRALTSFDSYHQATLRPGIEEYLDPEKDLIAYFCAEFGLHESLPIYSGGLGILAGDHCKAASDLGHPLHRGRHDVPSGLFQPDHRRSWQSDRTLHTHQFRQPRHRAGNTR